SAATWTTGTAGPTAGWGRTLAERGALRLARAAGARRARSRCTRARDARGAGGARTLHALVARKRVVTWTWCAGALHALVARGRVVARTRGSWAGNVGWRWRSF